MNFKDFETLRFSLMVDARNAQVGLDKNKLLNNLIDDLDRLKKRILELTIINRKPNALLKELASIHNTLEAIRLFEDITLIELHKARKDEYSKRGI